MIFPTPYLSKEPLSCSSHVLVGLAQRLGGGICVCGHRILCGRRTDLGRYLLRRRTIRHVLRDLRTLTTPLDHLLHMFHTLVTLRSAHPVSFVSAARDPLALLLLAFRHVSALSEASAGAALHVTHVGARAYREPAGFGDRSVVRGAAALARAPIAE